MTEQEAQQAQTIAEQAKAWRAKFAEWEKGQ